MSGPSLADLSWDEDPPDTDVKAVSEGLDGFNNAVVGPDNHEWLNVVARGYRVMCELPDLPAGHKKILLMKELAPPERTRLEEGCP